MRIESFKNKDIRQVKVAREQSVHEVDIVRNMFPFFARKVKQIYKNVHHLIQKKQKRDVDDDLSDILSCLPLIDENRHRVIRLLLLNEVFS